jgi:RNA polymerase sigma-70 factor (ECF subfamily)
MSTTSTVELQPDEALVDGVRHGEHDALAELYRRYADSVRNSAQRYTRCFAAAEDVCQEVFLRLPLAVHRYQERGYFKGWLRTLAARHALSWLRWSQSRVEFDLTEAAPVVHQDIDQVVARLALESAVAELPDTLRAVLVLKEIEGCSHREIAMQLGIDCGASKVRLFRARELLRKRLASEVGFDLPSVRN